MPSAVCPGRGRGCHLHSKGALHTPDYKQMYLAIFRASEQAVRLLAQAQAEAEARLLAAEEPPLQLWPGPARQPPCAGSAQSAQMPAGRQAAPQSPPGPAQAAPPNAAPPGKG